MGDFFKAPTEVANYVLKRKGEYENCYIRNDSAHDAGWWKWTDNIGDALHFRSQNEAMRFVSLSNDVYRCFNNGNVLSLVRVAEVEVVTTTKEWREV